jgi:hypothetical protein
MANGNGFSKEEDWRGNGHRELPGNEQLGNRVHPAWVAFVCFCGELRHGEINVHIARSAAVALMVSSLAGGPWFGRTEGSTRRGRRC